MRFLGWQDACAGTGHCTVQLEADRTVVARYAQRGSAWLRAWNFHTSCRPVKTTIPQILGAEVGPMGGASESGGRFQPHLRGEPEQHLLNPPCFIGSTPTFVELDDVQIVTTEGKQLDADDTATVIDPNRPGIASPYLKRIHVEIDGTWFMAGVAPALLPPPPARIDLQGFVFWDTGHVGAAWHSYSGWELHPVAGWTATLPTELR
ncbi:MAG TPA: hypothetical protein VF002_00250 [Gaiellaceae bacterium]